MLWYRFICTVFANTVNTVHVYSTRKPVHTLGSRELVVFMDHVKRSERGFALESLLATWGAADGASTACCSGLSWFAVEVLGEPVAVLIDEPVDGEASALLGNRSAPCDADVGTEGPSATSGASETSASAALVEFRLRDDGLCSSSGAIDTSCDSSPTSLHERASVGVACVTAGVDGPGVELLLLSIAGICAGESKCAGALVAD